MLSVRSFSLIAATASLSLLALTNATPANAQVTTYNNRATFNSATSGLTTINFNDQAPAGGLNSYSGATTTQQGVTFTSNGSLVAVSSSYNNGFGYGLGDGTVLAFFGGPNGLNTLNVALPANTTAFGLDFGDFYGLPFTFSLSTGQTYTFTGGNTLVGTSTFAGFTSTSAISGFTITVPNSPNDGLQIDRFSFGQANATAAVPEPSEWAVIGMTATTLGGLMVRARRRKGVTSGATV